MAIFTREFYYNQNHNSSRTTEEHSREPRDPSMRDPKERKIRKCRLDLGEGGGAAAAVSSLPLCELSRPGHTPIPQERPGGRRPRHTPIPHRAVTLSYPYPPLLVAEILQARDA